jgi:hypothetical protein
VDVKFNHSVFVTGDICSLPYLEDYLSHTWIPSEIRMLHSSGYNSPGSAFDTLSKRIDAPAPVKANIDYMFTGERDAVYACWEWPDGRDGGILCATYQQVNPLHGRRVCVDISRRLWLSDDVDQIAKCLVTHPDIPPELRLATPEGLPSLIGAFDTLARRVESEPEDDQARWTSVTDGAFSVEPEVVEIEMKNPPPRWEGHVPAYLKDPIPQWGDNCRCTVPTPAPDPSRYNATCPCGAPAYRGLDEFRLECSQGCK